jgi:hypothetical protein
MTASPVASPTFTLDEIRATDRAAWKEDYLFVEGRILRIVALPTPDGANHVHVRPSCLDESSPLVRDGWMLMPDWLDAGTADDRC